MIIKIKIIIINIYHKHINKFPVVVLFFEFQVQDTILSLIIDST